MITALTANQFRDPGRGVFRVKPRVVKDRRTRTPKLYRGRRVFRDAFGNEFITL